MKLTFKVDNVLDPFEKHDKKFYPVSIKDIQGPKGSYIFNALVEIPKDTVLVTGELYYYTDKNDSSKSGFRIKNIQPK